MRLFLTILCWIFRGSFTQKIKTNLWILRCWKDDFTRFSYPDIFQKFTFYVHTYVTKNRPFKLVWVRLWEKTLSLSFHLQYFILQHIETVHIHCLPHPLTNRLSSIHPFRRSFTKPLIFSLCELCSFHQSDE